MNPPKSDVSIFMLIIFGGMDGINAFPVPYPSAVNINPIIAVAIRPKNTAAGTF